jgi:hypothetical protein
VSNLDRRQFLLVSFPFFWRKRPFLTLDQVRFQVIHRGRSPHRYLLIHGNEESAREVLLDHMRSHPGVAYLVTGHERYVTVNSARLDPNRMFSREGAAKNLRALNPDLRQEKLESVLHTLDKGRKNLEQHLFPPLGGRLVALHNNSQGYSVKDEIPISDDTSIPQPDRPHEFFLCTDLSDYVTLRTSPYNVVWQWRAPRADDGSLSRLAARRGARYINLEVSLGDRAKQVEMLDWLEKKLP